MNQITKPQTTLNRIKPPEQPDRLPIDVLAATFDALIAKSNLEAIASRVNYANRLFNALDRASYDRNFSNKLDTPAAIAKLNDLRAQFHHDIVALDDILNKPATKAQVKSLAGIVPKIFGKTDVTHIDHWLAAVFMLLAGSISAPVMAKAIRELLGETKFMPAPCEFRDACCVVRRDVQRLRDEIVGLAKLPPPRLPELPAPLPEPIDAFDEMMTAENAAMPDPWGRSPEQLHGQTED